MTVAEKRLCEWQFSHFRQEPGFYDFLFDLMAHACKENLENLEKGFPDEVKAFRRFKAENKYWDNLEKEFLASKNMSI